MQRISLQAYRPTSTTAELNEGKRVKQVSLLPVNWRGGFSCYRGGQYLCLNKMNDVRRKGKMMSLYFDGEYELSIVKNRLSHGQDMDKCRLVFDMMCFCITPAHQLRHIYHEGTTDSCTEVHRAARLCAMMNLSGRPKEETVGDEHGNQNERKLDSVKMPWTFKEKYLSACGERTRDRYRLNEEETETG